MRNLILRADWNDFVLFDDYEAAEIDTHRLGSKLRNALSAWNAAYRPLLGQSRSPRMSASLEAQLAELDAKGRALAAALKPLFPDAVVRYAGDAGGSGIVV